MRWRIETCGENWQCQWLELYKLKAKGDKVKEMLLRCSVSSTILIENSDSGFAVDIMEMICVTL